MKLPNDLRWEATGRTLGSGGQATVIQVFDKNDASKKTYALKGLSHNKPEKAYKRFAKEIDAIKQIDHPFIIKIIDYSDPKSDFQYYVMEEIPNSKCLNKLLQTNKNPFFGNAIKAITFFMDIMDALSACMTAQIIHRDLSPSNVLITDNHQIKIIDFDLCQIQDSSRITLIDEGVGTQIYMAPEYEAGIESNISIASDIYSAGKLLWSAIANQFAFAREESVFKEKSMSKIFIDKPETYHLHHIFEKSIRYNAKERWQSPYSALMDSKNILNIIRSGYPPLEEIKNICPVCGFKKTENYSLSDAVYGDLRKVKANRCKYCGYIYHFDPSIARNNLHKREELE